MSDVSRVTAVLSTQQIQDLKQEWQSVLRLQDWEIDVDIIRRKTKRLCEDDNGLCNFDAKKREAYIMLLDGRDAPSDLMRPYDMEITLVHELLHCVWWVFTGKEVDDKEDVCQEQTIHAHAQLLVRMRRQTMPRRYARLGLT